MDWIDLDGDLVLTPGVDAVDLDADGEPGPDEIGRVLRATLVDYYDIPTDELTQGVRALDKRPWPIPNACRAARSSARFARFPRGNLDPIVRVDGDSVYGLHGAAFGIALEQSEALAVFTIHGTIVAMWQVEAMA